MQWRAALLYRATLAGHAVPCPDDTTLGSADEAKDIIPFFTGREALFYLYTSVCYVVAGIIYCLVDIFDCTNNIGREAAPAQTHDVNANIADRLVAAKNVRRNILDYP